MTGLLGAVKRLEEAVRKYSDDQPRDEHGRWTSGGGESASAREQQQGAALGARWQEVRAEDPEFGRSVGRYMRSANREQKVLIGRLQRIAPGTGVIDFKDDNQQTTRLISEHGKLFSSQGIQYVLNRAGSCHQNTAELYGTSKFPASKFGIATGYYSSSLPDRGRGDSGDGVWRSHSWLYDKQTGAVVETTGNKATHYFGLPLTRTEATEFKRTGGIIHDRR